MHMEKKLSLFRGEKEKRYRERATLRRIGRKGRRFLFPSKKGGRGRRIWEGEEHFLGKNEKPSP